MCGRGDGGFYWIFIGVYCDCGFSGLMGDAWMRGCVDVTLEVERVASENERARLYWEGVRSEERGSGTAWVKEGSRKKLRWVDRGFAEGARETVLGEGGRRDVPPARRV